MARLQVLTLPSRYDGEGELVDPFALILDELPPGIDPQPLADQLASFAVRIGGAGAAAFPMTVNIPANDPLPADRSATHAETLNAVRQALTEGLGGDLAGLVAALRGQLALLNGNTPVQPRPEPGMTTQDLPIGRGMPPAPKVPESLEQQRRIEPK
jgi:hypothetical protein